MSKKRKHFINKRFRIIKKYIPKKKGRQDQTPVCQKNLLFRTEDPVARIAETGNDVAFVVQLFVLCRAIDMHVRVRL